MSYPDRLATFQGFWDDHQATARQLAAIAHVYDRPPLEALEEGSRCISCSAFVRREHSIRALEGSVSSSGSYEHGFENFVFHLPGCIRLQIRMPLDPQATMGGLHGGFRISDMRSRFERRSTAMPTEAASGEERRQTSSLFSLPTELRLEIYSHVLPSLDSVTEIVPLNRDSARVVTKTGQEKTGPRDLTKANLLRTCKAVHNEALDILYNLTTYKFISTKILSATKTLYLFLRHIGKAGRELLRSVDVWCGNREDALAFALLATCSKLRAITIRLPRPVVLFPGAPIWCIDGMACLLSLSGLEEVRFGDCGPEFKMHMDESKHDAAIIKRELTRARGTAGSVRWVDGYLDV